MARVVKVMAQAWGAWIMENAAEAKFKQWSFRSFRTAPVRQVASLLFSLVDVLALIASKWLYSCVLGLGETTTCTTARCISEEFSCSRVWARCFHWPRSVRAGLSNLYHRRPMIRPQ